MASSPPFRISYAGRIQRVAGAGAVFVLPPNDAEYFARDLWLVFLVLSINLLYNATLGKANSNVNLDKTVIALVGASVVGSVIGAFFLFIGNEAVHSLVPNGIRHNHYTGNFGDISAGLVVRCADKNYIF